MTIYKCDHCGKEVRNLKVIRLKNNYELCEDCIKKADDFIKYCKHGNFVNDCRDCLKDK